MNIELYSKLDCTYYITQICIHYMGVDGCFGVTWGHLSYIHCVIFSMNSLLCWPV